LLAGFLLEEDPIKEMLEGLLRELMQVEKFQTKPLQAEYPFIWVDALYEEVRYNNRVVSLAIMIAQGGRYKGAEGGGFSGGADVGGE